jgi:hypothetical protein
MEFLLEYLQDHSNFHLILIQLNNNDVIRYSMDLHTKFIKKNQTFSLVFFFTKRRLKKFIIKE